VRRRGPRHAAIVGWRPRAGSRWPVGADAPRR
jgi:hypothetical protein